MSKFQHDGRHFVLAYNRIFSPNLLLSTRVGWNKLFTDRQPPIDVNLNAEAGFKGAETSAPGMARVIPSGFSQLGTGLNLPAQANSQTRGTGRPDARGGREARGRPGRHCCLP